MHDEQRIQTGLGGEVVARLAQIRFHAGKLPHLREQLSLLQVEPVLARVGVDWQHRRPQILGLHVVP